jgi:hypothetical protein
MIGPTNSNYNVNPYAPQMPDGPFVGGGSDEELPVRSKSIRKQTPSKPLLTLSDIYGGMKSYLKRLTFALLGKEPPKPKFDKYESVSPTGLVEKNEYPTSKDGDPIVGSWPESFAPPPVPRRFTTPSNNPNIAIAQNQIKSAEAFGDIMQQLATQENEQAAMMNLIKGAGSSGFDLGSLPE